LIKTDPNRLANVQATLAELGRQEGLLLKDFADLRRMLDDILNAVIGCFWGLLALGFIVASFGIVNTLTMNVLEQTRELGLLRAVGMTRRQIRKMMLCQAVILGVMGAVLGVLAGITSAYVINVGNQPLLGHPTEFKLHVNMLLLCLAGAFALVTLASYFPSKRAANLDLVEALAYE
jgi:putative ABC transport system permease protein